MLFVSKSNLLDFFLFYFTVAGVKCRTAVVKRLPVLHHGADYSIGWYPILLSVLERRGCMWPRELHISIR